MPTTETLKNTPAAGNGRGRLAIDAPVRMFHALFALCFFAAWATSECERWRAVHVMVGYGMAGLLLFRLAYGLFGPPQARLSRLPERCRGLLARLWPDKAGGPASAVSGGGLAALQNAAMALAVLGLLALVAAALVSGYLAWNDAPEWVADLHEEMGEALIALAVAHIALVAGFSLLRGRNLAIPMLTGRIPGPGEDLIPHSRPWLAAALLAAVCAFAVVCVV
ncbi:MAG: cytochrome b/b6 domain-containing protein [Azoarcus sp.]|jgi:cytochrome b|nr:cytochrome b/b6 domain-containing protein [Azoarcus sp.]